jgi:hypothetical protein
VVWGKILGTVGEDGQLTPAPCDPDPEVERLRAELVNFRTRVGDVLATLREMRASHLEAVCDPERGWDEFQRAEAYKRATDLLKEALMVGGEPANAGQAYPAGHAE